MRGQHPAVPRAPLCPQHPTQPALLSRLPSQAQPLGPPASGRQRPGAHGQSGAAPSGAAPRAEPRVAHARPGSVPCRAPCPGGREARAVEGGQVRTRRPSGSPGPTLPPAARGGCAERPAPPAIRSQDEVPGTGCPPSTDGSQQVPGGPEQARAPGAVGRGPLAGAHPIAHPLGRSVSWWGRWGACPAARTSLNAPFLSPPSPDLGPQTSTSPGRLVRSPRSMPVPCPLAPPPLHALSLPHAVLSRPCLGGSLTTGCSQPCPLPGRSMTCRYRPFRGPAARGSCRLSTGPVPLCLASCRAGAGTPHPSSRGRSQTGLGCGPDLTLLPTAVPGFCGGAEVLGTVSGPW